MGVEIGGGGGGWGGALLAYCKPFLYYILLLILRSLISDRAVSATKIVGYNKAIIRLAQGLCFARKVCEHTCGVGTLSL